jgi:histidinol-phosphate aminotransferase
MTPTDYLAPEHVRRIPPYPAGKPADLLRAELGVERLICLAANENTAGPSPRALAAIREAAAGAWSYPNGPGHHLRHRLAGRYGLGDDQVVLGNGSAEVVELLCHTFLTPGQRVAVSRLGFLQYRMSAAAAGAEVVEAPLRPGTRREDPEALAAAARTARLAFIANPNNPTGTFLSRGDLETYFRGAGDGVLTVIDQAYREYVDDPDYPDARDDLAAGRRVVVLGTFSKIHALAGLRIGYGLGPAAILAQIECARLPFNTSSIAQAAALGALDDPEHVTAARERNRVEREGLAAALARRRLGVTPSLANFLLVDFPGPTAEVLAGLRAQGVLVCPMAPYGLPASLRITVGTREENEALLAALDRLDLTR